MKKITKLNDTTFNVVPKNDPKDRIEVEVGDAKQETFYPQVKLMRWDNEVNMSIRMVDDNTGSFTKIGDKVIYDKPDRKVEFYEGEEGHKMVWFLKEKPASNKIEFTINTKGLDFFYQPELTQQEIDEGCHRPENVVGSYAVYHKTKGGMNDINGMEYKVGKAFHIFRPKIIDSDGKETWGILNIDTEQGTYTVEIPQEFLDKAVYPIKSNDDFGYTAEGTSGNTGFANNIIGSVFPTDGSDGTITSMTYFGFSTAGGKKVMLTLHNPNNTVNSYTDEWTTAVFDGEHEISIDLGGTILASTSYYLGFWIANNDDNRIYYDSTGGTGFYDNTQTYDSGAPDTLDPTDYGTRKFSIYATYTPSGGGSSASPSISPSISPSVSPSSSLSPSLSPSISPSVSPSSSLSPSISPSISSSVSPSSSLSPSISPSLSPSISPSVSPSVSLSPSISPSLSPSLSPSISPSISPSVSPSVSLSPSISPSLSASLSPSISPSPSPGWENYTKGDYANLPTGIVDLENAYSDQDYLDVDTKNDVRVSQTATGEYTIHQFKDYVGAESSCTLEWEGQTNQACTWSPVVLQIFNNNTPAWETVDSDRFN